MKKFEPLEAEYRQRWHCKHIAGIDESGYGALMGPAVIVGVVFEKKPDYIGMLNDCKRLHNGRRIDLYERLINDPHIRHAIGWIYPWQIDATDVVKAGYLVARDVVVPQLKPDGILMDGQIRIPRLYLPQKAIVRGDVKCASIAAASIIAKITLDKYIMKIATQFHRDYNFVKNKGYWSEKHVQALIEHGLTPLHRKKYVETTLKNVRRRNNDQKEEKDPRLAFHER